MNWNKVENNKCSNTLNKPIKIFKGFKKVNKHPPKPKNKLQEAVLYWNYIENSKCSVILLKQIQLFKNVKTSKIKSIDPQKTNNP